MRRLKGTAHFFWLGWAVFILVAEAFVFHRTWTDFNASNSRSIRTHVVLESIESLLSSVKDAEAGQRGYLLTGREEYLSPYHSALARLPEELDRLGKLTSDNPEQQRRVTELHSLIHERIAFIEKSFERRQQRREAPGPADVLSNQGRDIMDQIQAVAGAMKIHELMLLDQRNRDTRQAGVTAVAALSIGGGVLLVVLIYGAWAIDRQSRRLAEMATISGRQASMIQLAHEAITVLDRERTIISWNRGAEELYGWTDAEAVGKPIKELLQTETPGPLASVRDAIEREGRWEGELVQRRRDGTRVIVDSRQAVIRDENGAIIGTLEVNRDITGSKAISEALELSRQRLQLVLSSVDLGLWYCDLPFDKLVWNAKCREHFGIPAETEVTFDMFMERIHPDDRERTRRTIDRCIRDHSRYDIDFRTVGLDGTVRWIRAIGRAFYNEAGSPVRFDGVTLDVTRQKQLESDLRDSNQALRAIIDNAPVAIWAIDIDGRVTLWSPTAERLFGWTAEEVTGQFSPIVPDAELQDYRHFLDEAKRGRMLLDREVTRQRKDGGKVELALSMAALRDVTGPVIGFITMATDITERKKLQAHLQEKQKLESVGLLAGGIAHDFNNLLVGILGNASLALDTILPESTLRNFIEPIQRSGERAADLVRQLLAYAGKGRFVIEPVDISELVRDITSLVQSALPPKIQLKLDLAEQPPLIESDRIQMQQLIMNLVLNAGEAIGDKEGSVTVKTRIQELGADYIRRVLPKSELAPGRYVLLEVADDGIGMDAATKARIFDPFFTTKFTGRGLGLAAAQGIVRSHGGVINVFSSPGMGSTFQILLPAQAAVERAVPEPVLADCMPGTGVVLVVDDEEMVRNMASFALERNGYKVLLAADGQTSVEIFERNAERISAVLLDLKMPGMSGTEALELMQRIRPEVKVIACTGYGEADAARLFGDRRIAAFLQKPFTAQKLAATVGKVVTSQAAIAPEA